MGRNKEYQSYEVKPGQPMADAYANAAATRPNCYAYAIGGINEGIDPGYGGYFKHEQNDSISSFFAKAPNSSFPAAIILCALEFCLLENMGNWFL